MTGIGLGKLVPDPGSQMAYEVGHRVSGRADRPGRGGGHSEKARDVLALMMRAPLDARILPVSIGAGS